MVTFTVEDLSDSRWSVIVAAFPGLSLMQCWAYGEAKARTGPWRVERGLFRQGDEIVGAVQTLIRALPAALPSGLAWINRGPLGSDPSLLVAMLAALKEHYAGQRRLYLRLAPAVAEDALPDGLAPGFGMTATAGWASATLDLAPEAQALRKGLGQKWRNGLNRAERLGLEVRHGYDDSLFANLLDGYDAMTRERQLATTVTRDLLRVLRDLLPGGLVSFLACRDGTAVGSALIVRYGDTAEYLAGWVAEEGRKINAGQLLLWRAVLVMKEGGVARFDLGGLDPALTPPGIARFKTGLGGVPYRLAPELEAVGGGVLGRMVRWRVGRARVSG